MNTVEVKGALRQNLGKPEAKRLRKEEKVPCVLYGIETPVHFSTPVNSFKKLVYTPDAYLVKIDVDGTSYDAILQDAQYHPVSDEIIHADFLKISDDKPVTIEIPVTTSGNSVGVIAGGRLTTNLRSLKVKALPSKLPDVIDIDVTNIELGETIKVHEVALGEGVVALNAANAVVVAVKTTRVSRSADDALEGGVEEGAEEAATEEAAEA